MAYERCCGLLDADGACAHCVALELTVAAGSGAVARMLLRNVSHVGRPLFLIGLWTRGPQGERRGFELPWTRLEAGSQAPLTVPGSKPFEVLIGVASRWSWREERLAFAGRLEPGQTRAVLRRARRAELDLGLRGLHDGTRVERGVELTWRGFEPGEAPLDGPLTGIEGGLALGRSRSKAQGGCGDVRLTARDKRGRADPAAGRGISRRHFTLCIENERLVLRVESEGGAWINARAVPRGTTLLLRDGDRFSPLPPTWGRSSVGVAFSACGAQVHGVTLTRD